MDLEAGLVALFQAPFEDAETVSARRLVTGYSSVFSALQGYADDVDAIEVTTVDLANRQASADIFVTASLCACFAALAEGMAARAHGKDYATAEDVDGDQATLSAAWAALGQRSFAPDLRAQLAEIFSRTSAVLHGLEVTLPRIVVVDAPDVPASVLSYWLYDTDATLDTLVGLNPDQPTWLYSGSTLALSQ